MGQGSVRLPRHGEAMSLTIEARAGLHEVLLQAALRAERRKAAKAADERAREIARRMDKRAAEART